ncbi:MAG: 4-hydroxythreonine-4-phosphate dehydrogenase PdxA [Parvibaculaceae bacterium]
MARPLPPLAVTMGEPAGIGPDIILAAWRMLKGKPRSAFLVIGDDRLFRSRAQGLGLDVAIRRIAEPSEATPIFADALPLLEEPLPHLPQAGKPDSGTAGAVIACIEKAVTLALDGRIAGIVTGPIQKETLYAAGFSHQGHTDFLAHLAERAGHGAEPVMMLSSGTFRTVPVTVHIPLKNVPAALTTELIVRQARVCVADLAPLLRRRPRLVVTGLNPHAGEGATIGTEDRDIIVPAVKRLKDDGIDVVGPVAADSTFHAQARAGFDLALCMYHDQALIPVKTLGFHNGINTTLGLPFVRTSPDHGTALSLAGSGKADPRSLIAAIDMARRLAASGRWPKPR